MNGPAWYSQPYPPEGASAAEGIRNQLGRPELDPLTILVRESAQNSWDARMPGSTAPVDYRIDLYAVGPAQVGVWRELLLKEAPLTTHLPLRAFLQEADAAGDGHLGPGDERPRWSNPGGFTAVAPGGTISRSIVRRHRRTRRTSELGGGTYGFGKGIFYLLSEAGTVLLHTRCRTADGYETRLMGCSRSGRATSPRRQRANDATRGATGGGTPRARWWSP